MAEISTKWKNGRSLMSCVLALAVAFGLLCALSSQSAAATYIGEAKAKSIALQHAGVSAAKAKVVKFKQYDKRGTALYDIVFLTDDAKYSYEINAVTGEIFAYYRNARNGTQPGDVAAASGNQSYIGSEKAEAIALAHAKVSRSSVQEFEVKLDSHKGRATYEVEFTTDRNIEYEYEIDAITGDILKWKTDRD